MTTSVLCGLGAALPATVVTNAELCERLDTTEQWILSRTGIATRRVAPPGVGTGDLAVEAAARALKSAGSGEVQALVLATATPDRPCPALAPEVAARLGLTGIAAFDVAAVCTGFVYALATASGLLAGGLAERALVVGADRFSSLLDPADRGTVPIFGDGAGAVVLRRGEPAEPGAFGAFVLGSDGGLADLIKVDGFFRMRGREVFRHAVERMSAAVAAAAAAAGWALSDVDRLVLHQANARIASAIGTELGIPPERLAQNIGTVGNTAAASIPLLLTEDAAAGRLAPGDRVVLAAFGGGLTWGASTLVWPDPAVDPPADVQPPQH
jgi:3-oxoacyl-[acyl-carrier-protein] synthase III